MAIPLLRDVAPRRRTTPASGPSSNPSPSSKPSLVVVEQRRRWPVLLAGLAWTFVVLGLLGAAVFHTQLAERQLRIDRLERSVSSERERFDDLRYQRAELRSPVRLAAAAGALGMQRGAASEFIAVLPDAVARELATSGAIDDRVVQIIVRSDPLDQFRDVKSVTEEGP